MNKFEKKIKEMMSGDEEHINHWENARRIIITYKIPNVNSLISKIDNLVKSEESRKKRIELFNLKNFLEKKRKELEI